MSSRRAAFARARCRSAGTASLCPVAAPPEQVDPQPKDGERNHHEHACCNPGGGRVRYRRLGDGNAGHSERDHEAGQNES